MKDTLKDILLKDWHHSHSRTPSISPPKRPPTMRMKDSDDYITARAANPRTGLISPSIGTNTPRQSCTPETPGEALKLGPEHHPSSPTPEIKARPALRRMNEGRKVSVGGTHKWRADGHGWNVGKDAIVDSPKVSHVRPDAGQLTSKSLSALGDDELVVHMPSAHEPQPYAYPGYSTKQIEAYQHYKQKARRVSSEGYDQRIFQGVRQASNDASKTATGKSSCGLENAKCGHVAPCKNAQAPSNRTITIIKRGEGNDSCMYAADRTKTSCCPSGAELSATSFAPFSSPKTPKISTGEQELENMHSLPGACFKSIDRKPVGSARIDASSQELNNEPANLRQLPRITLVHPSIAAIPRSSPVHDAVGASIESPRKCSLGCQREGDGEICVERRLNSVQSSPSARTPLFEDSPSPGHSEDSSVLAAEQSQMSKAQTAPTAAQNVSEALVMVIIGVFDACKKVPWPSLSHFSMLDTLMAENATPAQKAEALKQLLASAGQVLGLLAILAMLWQIGTLIANALEIILWPLMVPFKVLRWLSNVG